MEAGNHSHLRVRELAQRVADGLADEEAMAELDMLLRATPAARRSYLDMMALHFDLDRRAATGALSTAEHRRPLEPQRFFRIVLAVAALVIIGLGAWWVARAGAPVATIVKSSGDAWRGGALGGAVIRDGQAFDVLSGLIELETTEGVRLVIEGPWSGRFRGPQAIELASGKIFAEVPERARGFTVATPAGRAVDLGTRFAVEASGDGATTQIHVFEGRVVAAMDGIGVSEELATGEAVLLDKAVAAMRPTAFIDERFVQVVGPFYEPFTAGRGSEVWPPPGTGGWIAADVAQERSRLGYSARVLSYPGLAMPQGGSLESWPGRAPPNPVGHRWPFAFSSAILQMDDDLTKKLRVEPNVAVTLVSFGTSEGGDGRQLRLVVDSEPESHRAQCRLGLATGEELAFGPDSYHPTQVFFVVLQRGATSARLWINPDPADLGQATPPAPDVVLPLASATDPEMLWLGDGGEPAFSYWWLDELRGGDSWSEVTPTMEN